MANDVTAQESKVVGDEAAEVGPVQVHHDDTPVKAQVSPEREPAAAEVAADVTVVQVDEVITDPSDPRAVQVPDAGRGEVSPSAHRLRDPRPEEVFAASAKRGKKS